MSSVYTLEVMRMSREEFIQQAIEILEPMSPKERGELIGELLQISLKMAMDESMSDNVKKVFKDKESKTA